MFLLSELEEIVKKSGSYRDVLRGLGYSITNSNQRDNIRRFIRTHDIDISHFGKRRVAKSPRWKDHDNLRLIASESTSMSDFLFRLGLKNKGSNFETAKYHLERLSIDVTHFSLKGSHGKRVGGQLETPLIEILEGKHSKYSSFKLKKRLLSTGIKNNECELCGQIAIWQGNPLKMHIDHKNGDSEDHRLANLRILCPNCHSQTETYSGKNRKNNSPLV